MTCHICLIFLCLVFTKRESWQRSLAPASHVRREFISSWSILNPLPAVELYYNRILSSVTHTLYTSPPAAGIPNNSLLCSFRKSTSHLNPRKHDDNVDKNLSVAVFSIAGNCERKRRGKDTKLAIKNAMVGFS